MNPKRETRSGKMEYVCNVCGYRKTGPKETKEKKKEQKQNLQDSMIPDFIDEASMLRDSSSDTSPESIRQATPLTPAKQLKKRRVEAKPSPESKKEVTDPLKKEIANLTQAAKKSDALEIQKRKELLSLKDVAATLKRDVAELTRTAKERKASEIQKRKELLALMERFTESFDKKLQNIEKEVKELQDDFQNMKKEMAKHVDAET